MMLMIFHRFSEFPRKMFAEICPKAMKFPTKPKSTLDKVHRKMNATWWWRWFIKFSYFSQKRGNPKNQWIWLFGSSQWVALIILCRWPKVVFGFVGIFMVFGQISATCFHGNFEKLENAKKLYNLVQYCILICINIYKYNKIEWNIMT